VIVRGTQGRVVLVLLDVRFGCQAKILLPANPTLKDTRTATRSTTGLHIALHAHAKASQCLGPTKTELPEKLLDELAQSD
jgi:hypothetical protein